MISLCFFRCLFLCLARNSRIRFPNSFFCASDKLSILIAFYVQKLTAYADAGIQVNFPKKEIEGIQESDLYSCQLIKE